MLVVGTRVVVKAAVFMSMNVAAAVRINNKAAEMALLVFPCFCKM